jgi:hypothetical protein
MSKAGKLCFNPTTRVTFSSFSINSQFFENESYTNVTLSQVAISSFFQQALRIKLTDTKLRIKANSLFIFNFI